MIIFSGNELIFGIIFVNWLLCIAIGSWGLGKLTDELSNRSDFLVITFILSSIILPLQILIVRGMGNWLSVKSGEMIGLFPTFYSTFLVLLPFCSLHGFQFTLGCKLAEGIFNKTSSQIGLVYVLESMGSVVGGLVFTYLLASNLRVLEFSVALSLLNLLLIIFLLGPGMFSITKTTTSRLLAVITLLLIVVAGYAQLSGLIASSEEESYRRQWRSLELVHYQNSIYGNIAITHSNEQLDFWVNGLPLFTAPDPDILFIEDIVHFPLLFHPAPEKVLLIAGGLSGALEEILKHPVSNVYYLELDPLIIELSTKYSETISKILEEPRIEVVSGDGRLFVKKAESLFDVVIVNLPPPSTLQLNRYYTLEFFKEVFDILDDDGVFSVCLSSSMTHISEEMGIRNRCIYETIKEVFPSWLVVPGDYNIFLASPSVQERILGYDSDILYQRLLERGVNTDIFSEDYLRYKFANERLKRGLSYLNQNHIDLNRDMRPVAVYYDLVLWNTLHNLNSRRLFTYLSNFDLSLLFVLLILLIPALLTIRRWVGAFHISIYLSIFTTGIAGMTFNIVMLYAFQALYGHLYQEIGVVTVAFMSGLALGGWSISNKMKSDRVDINTLAKSEMVIIAYSLLLSLTFSFFNFYKVEPFLLQFIRVLFPLLNFVSGFFVGLEFPLASSICLRSRNNIGRVSGVIYASDLFGGCVGALFSSIWFIPLYGIRGACFLIATLNAVSLIFLYMTLQN